MKIRRSAPAAIVIAVVVVVALSTLFSIRLFSGMTDSVEADQFRMMRSIVETAINDAQSKALARAELIASLPNVQKMFAAKDRPGLIVELGKMFAEQKARHGVDQAQFHLPPATSFLRLHDPETFGDDLTKFRPMVVAVNRDRTPLKGLAIARNGPAIFGVATISDGTNYLGSFEIGVDIAPLLSALKTAYGMDLAFFVDEGDLRTYANGVDPERLGDQNRVGRYIRFESTNSDLMAQLAKPEDLAVVNEPVTYVRTLNGLSRGVVLLPVNNSAGTPLGVIAATVDFSASRASADKTLIWQVALGVIAVLVLSGIVLVVLRGFLLRPIALLNNRFNAIHSGEPLTEIPGSERFPEELHQFLGLYENIRARRKAAEKRP